MELVSAALGDLWSLDPLPCMKDPMKQASWSQRDGFHQRKLPILPNSDNFNFTVLPLKHKLDLQASRNGIHFRFLGNSGERCQLLVTCIIWLVSGQYSAKKKRGRNLYHFTKCTSESIKASWAPAEWQNKFVKHKVLSDSEVTWDKIYLFNI